MARYPPLDTLKPIAADAWIVDGPIIRFGMPWPKMPFPTRMAAAPGQRRPVRAHAPGREDPHDSKPRDMRRTFKCQRAQLRAAVERMLACDPERIVLAHGRWYETEGSAELRRAFGWLPG